MIFFPHTVRAFPSRRFSVFAVAGVLLFFAGRDASAQRYVVHTYSETDGLPSATINGLAQDSSGAIWASTRAGLTRYDGLNWTTFTPADGLPWKEGSLVFVDRDGTVVAFPGRTPLRPARFDGKEWHPDAPATGLDANRIIDFGAVIGEGEDARFLLAGHSGCLHFGRGGEWIRLRERTNVGEIGPIVAVDGRFFLASDRGLLRVDPAADVAKLALVENLPAELIRGVGDDPGSTFFWVVGSDWIGTFTGDSLSRLAENLDFGLERYFPWFQVVPDREGGIYLGNPAGVFHFDPDRNDGGSALELLDRKNGLIAPGATAMLLDREGILWVGGHRGLSKIVSRSVWSLDGESGLFADEVSALIQRKDGSIVLGHPGGVTLLGPPVRTFPTSASSGFRGRVLDMTEDGEGNLWVVASWEGMLRLDETVGTWRHYPIPGTENFPVAALLHDPAGTIWTAGESGIFRLHDDRFERVDSLHIPNARIRVRRMVSARDGGFYLFSICRGLFHWRDGTTRRWVSSEDPAGNSVFSLYETPEGPVWVGTGAGLYELVPKGGLRKLHDGALSIDRPVYSMVADAEGRVWFGTDGGVFRWDGAGLIRLTARDGLAGLEANRAAALLDTRNRIWIGTDRGVTVFEPRFERSGRAAPKVEMVGVESRGVLYPSSGGLRIPHAGNTLTFRFNAYSFIDERRMRYTTWLEGFENGWSEETALPLRQIRYTNVPPGEYRFHVRAVAPNGRISDEAESGTITVKAPFVRTPLFQVLAILSLLFVVGGVAVLLLERRHARVLERAVRERTAELRRSEKEVSEEREKLAAILGGVADGVVATDEKGRVILWNRAAARITGRTAAESLGRNLDELIPGVPKKGSSEGGGARPNDPVPDEAVLFNRPRGGTCWLEFSSAVVGGGAAPVGRILTFRDMSDKRRLKEELSRRERLDALGILAGGIAHDFNNLLMIILGNLGTLGERASGDRSRDQSVESARLATLQAAELTRQLLTFSKGGSPVLRTSSIVDLARESASLILRGSNCWCDFDFADPVPPVEIDRGQISQVLNNILLNAREAMPGGGMIRVRGYREEHPPAFLPEGDYVVLEIEDEGGGIPRENLGRIFDPYFSTKERGSGLGLATAHSIIERHGGRIHVESEEGRGSIFRIHLPMSRSAVEKNRREPSPPVPVRGAGRILVVDDEELVREVMVKMLTRLGYSAVAAPDGRRAVRLYGEALREGRPFDAVITDLTMPDGPDGSETVAMLRKIDPHVRAIAASGYSDDPVLARTSEHGFAAGLAKPFHMRELSGVLRSVLGSD